MFYAHVQCVMHTAIYFFTKMYMAGMRNLNLTFVVKEIAWPVILLLSLCITVPYTFFFGVLQGFG